MSATRFLVPTTLALGAGIAALVWLPSLGSPANAALPAPPPATGSAEDLSSAFKYVSKTLQPSVVSINTTRSIELDSEDPMLRFFQRLHPDMQGPDGAPGGAPGSAEERGGGSGVIVSDDGYILTNNHVVGGADDIEVVLNNGKRLPAKLVGRDEEFDLAVIQVDADHLVPAQLGDSDALEVGDWVVAIGSPFGLDHTVTTGIVSAIGRAGVGLNGYEDYLQTDAAINPGNSGGPLASLNGQVIGINTAISTETGAYNGIGFAIPSNVARRVMESLIQGEPFARGYLGITMQDLEQPGLAQSFHFDGTDGVLVSDVAAGSPADKAGLRVGDIVTAMDGRPMKDMGQLHSAVATSKPGSRVQLDLSRDGKPAKVSVEIGERPKDFDALAQSRGRNGGPDGLSGGGRYANADLGVAVQDLTPSLSRQLRAGSVSGVAVAEVQDGSLAAQAGIRPGMIITQVGEDAVGSVEDFQRAMDRASLARGVRIQLYERGSHSFVILQRGR